MGGIGTSRNGALFAVWTRSSATAGHYPSSYGAYQPPTDALNSISPPELLAAGQTNYSGLRWGDYVGVAQDPADWDVVWQGNEYVSSDAKWATLVSTQAEVVTATYVPLTPTRLLDTRFGNGLSGRFVSYTPRSFQVSGLRRVPSSAVAVTGNLTVTEQTHLGYIYARAGRGRQPDDLDPELPGRRQPGQRGDRGPQPDGKLAATYGAVAAHPPTWCST